MPHILRKSCLELVPLQSAGSPSRCFTEIRYWGPHWSRFWTNTTAGSGILGGVDYFDWAAPWSKCSDGSPMPRFGHKPAICLCRFQGTMNITQWVPWHKHLEITLSIKIYLAMYMVYDVNIYPVYDTLIRWHIFSFCIFVCCLFRFICGFPACVSYALWVTMLNKWCE